VPAVDGRLLLDSRGALLRLLDERDISEELAKAALRALFLALCAADDDAFVQVFEGIARNSRRNLEHRLKFVGMASSCGNDAVSRKIPADVVCRMLVPVLEDDMGSNTGDHRGEHRGGNGGKRVDDAAARRKALAKEVFNSLVGAVGHDRALRGYNAAKERRKAARRDRIEKKFGGRTTS
jgi:hypothetical protein